MTMQAARYCWKKDSASAGEPMGCNDFVSVGNFSLKFFGESGQRHEEEGEREKGGGEK